MSVQEGWSLARDGILWKRVVGSWTKEEAIPFVEQLEASVGPVDILCGMLLDRIAAAFLRQKILFEALVCVCPDLTIARPLSRFPDQVKEQVSSPWFVNLLKYENLLNQAFHRDLILLQTLQKSHVATLSAKKPSGSVRGLIEGQAVSNAANQAAGSSAEMKPAPVARKRRVKRSALDDNSPRVDLD